MKGVYMLLHKLVKQPEDEWPDVTEAQCRQMLRDTDRSVRCGPFRSVPAQTWAQSRRGCGGRLFAARWG